MENMVPTYPYTAKNNDIENDPATSEGSATNYFKSGNTGNRIESSYTGNSGPSSVSVFEADPASKTVYPVLAKLISANKYNPKDFTITTNEARYFVMKRYSGDDIHRSIKYSIWCSTNHGNKILDAAFKEREGKGPVYLLFSVTGSGHFCGVAQMMSMVDFSQSAGVWTQDKWKGQIEVKWIYVKDVPNSELRHICLENNENKPVTNSRDTQEVPPEKGKLVLKIVHNYKHSSSIFDDFGHYEKRQEEEICHPQRPKLRYIPETKLTRVSDRLQNNFRISENCFRMFKLMPPDPYSAINDCIEKELATSKGSSTNYSNSLNEGNHCPSQSLYTGQPGPSSVCALAADAANRTVPPVLAKLISANKYNPKDFTISTNEARYFVMKRYLGDDIHRSIKYSIWCSTNHGNKILDAAFKEREGKGPVYLLFSVTGSRCFCGVAQMMSTVDYSQSAGVWTSDKWKGQFEVKWIYVKDVPNSELRHICLENNENKPVTHSRDTQEVPPEKGKLVLKIVHNYKHSTSIFDHFVCYEKRHEEEICHPQRPKLGHRPKTVESSVKKQNIYNPSFSFPDNTGNVEGARANEGDTSMFFAVGGYDFNGMFSGFGYPPCTEYLKPSDQNATVQRQGRKKAGGYITEDYDGMNNPVPTDLRTAINRDMEGDSAIAGMEQNFKRMNIWMENQVEGSATNELQHAPMDPSMQHESISKTCSSRAPKTISWVAIADQPAHPQTQKPRSISRAHANPTKQSFDIGTWESNKTSAGGGDGKSLQLKPLRSWKAPRSKRSATGYSNSGNTGKSIQSQRLSTGNFDQNIPN